MRSLSQIKGALPFVTFQEVTTEAKGCETNGTWLQALKALCFGVSLVPTKQASSEALGFGFTDGSSLYKP